MTPERKTLLEKLRMLSDSINTFARVVSDHGPRPCLRAAYWAAAPCCLKTRVKQNRLLPVVRLANRKAAAPWLALELDETAADTERLLAVSRIVTGAGEAEEQGGWEDGEAIPILPGKELMGLLEMRWDPFILQAEEETRVLTEGEEKDWYSPQVQRRERDKSIGVFEPDFLRLDGWVEEGEKEQGEEEYAEARGENEEKEEREVEREDTKEEEGGEHEPLIV